MEKVLVSPYQKAWQWIDQHAGTASALKLARLLLTCSDRRCAFSVEECTEDLDESCMKLALDTVAYFNQHGPDEELRVISAQIKEAYPRLWTWDLAWSDAIRALREQRRAANIRAAYED